MSGTPDIIIAGGQSNGAGRGVVDSSIDTTDARVTQYDGNSASGTYRTLITAVDPLKHPEPTSTGVGPAMFAAKRYADLTGRDVVLVPCAWGGTSLVGGTPTWQAGGRDRENAVTQANLAVAAVRATYPSANVVGFLWIQGESDADNHVTQAAYQQAAWWLFQDLRERITSAADAWVVIGQMLPEAISANIDNASGAGTYPDIDAAHTALGSKLRKCAKVAIGAGYAKTESRLLHYNAAGARLMGTAMANAVAAASAAAGEAVPGQVTGLTAGASTATAQPLSWTAPASGGEVLDYVIERSASGAGTWSVAADGISTSSTYTAVGLTGGTAYDWRVTARGYGGAGTPSSTITTTQPVSTAVPVQLQSITGGKVTQGGSGETGFTYTVPAGTVGAAYASDHAGVSTHKLASGVDGSFRINTGVHWANSSSNYNTVLIGVVKANTDPVYSAGAAAGYSPAGVMLHTGNTYRLIVNGAASSTAPTTTVTAQSYDWIQIRRTSGRLYAEVARQATPDTWTVIYDFGAGNLYTGDLWFAASFSSAGTAPARTYGPLLGVNVTTGLADRTGPAAAAESGADACSASGQLSAAADPSGALAATEAASDTGAVAGSVDATGLTGSMSVAEAGADAPAVSGSAAVVGSAAAQESTQDGAAVSGSAVVQGGAVVGESGADAASIVGAVSPMLQPGDLAATESGSDACAASGAVAVVGAAAASESAADLATLQGSVDVGRAGSLAAVEAGPDVAGGAGLIVVGGLIAAVESGSDVMLSVPPGVFTAVSRYRLGARRLTSGAARIGSRIS